jgi:hypothetical protein
MPFLTKTSRAVGTSPTAIGAGATPASGKTWIVIGMTLCNILPAAISVTVHLLDAAAASTRILKDFTIPAGETVCPEGSLGKIIMQPTETMVVTASVASAVDVTMTVLETP